EGTERAWVPGRRGWRAEIRGFSIRPPKEIGRKTGIERDDAEQSKVRACPFPSSAKHAVTKAKVPVSFQGRRVACQHCKGSFAVARQPSPEEDVQDFCSFHWPLFSTVTGPPAGVSSTTCPRKAAIARNCSSVMFLALI